MTAATAEGFGRRRGLPDLELPLPKSVSRRDGIGAQRLLIERSEEIGEEPKQMGGLLLALVIIPGLIGLAVWERGGGHVPKMPEVELPVHGVPALLFALAIAMLALAIIAIDLAIISTTVD
jgi:hypothetical protein